MDRLELRLLGSMELLARGEVVDLPASKKTRALLGFLALEPGDHTRSRLCDLLWDGPADPRAALRWSLSKLRPLVDSDSPAILADRERVQLCGAALTIDLDEVYALLSQDLSVMDSEALEACALRFRGELLEGLELDDCFVYSQWLESKREKARNLRVRVLSTLSARTAEDADRGLNHARAWVALEPLDAGAHASLIAWLGRLGRPAAARKAAEACRVLFQRELGRPPGSVVDRSLLEALRLPARTTTTEVRSPQRHEPVPRNAGLFGRAEECAALERFLRPADAHGALPLLLIEGEPGIGKSRLLTELQERARRCGYETAYAKAYEAESARPLALWTEILGESPTTQEALRDRLFASMRDRIMERTGAAGFTLALDDLQWIDEVSAAFLSWLARRENPRLRIAIAVRPGELTDNPAARRLLRALGRDRVVDRLGLEPLSAEDTHALVRSVDTTADSDRIIELCGGNPLFAIELARAGNASSTRIQSCIAERLDRLSDAERELLRVGAALGRTFSLELVSEVTHMQPGELLRTVDSLESRGFVRVRDSEEIDFAHDLLRQATYEELSDPARRLLHRRIARTLSSDSKSDSELAPLLARQAGLGGDHALAAHACAAAGERCLRLHASEEAAAFARRGLRHSASLSAAEQRSLRAKLHAIEVHAGLGRRDGETLREELTKLAQTAGALGEHETARTTFYLLSILDQEAGHFQDAERSTLAALDAGRHAEPLTEVCALANSGRCLAQLERELERAEQFLVEAEARPSVPAARVDASWGLGLIAWHRNDLVEAARRLAHALEGASGLENHWAAFECMSRLALVELEAGASHRVLARADELRHAAGRLAGGSEEALAETIIALSSYARDSASAAEPFELSLDELRRQDSKAALSMVLIAAAQLDRARGRQANALRWAREAHDAAELVGRQRQLDRSRQLLDALGEKQQAEPENER